MQKEVHSNPHENSLQKLKTETKYNHASVSNYQFI